MKKLFAAVLLMVGVVFSYPTLAAKVSPSEVPGATTIDTSMAKKLFDGGVLFVDVRKDSDWDAGRVPNAAHLELKKVLNERELAKIVAKDKPVVIYCNGPKC